MHDPVVVEVVGLLLLAGLCGYLGLCWLPRRHRPWPMWRALSWCAGLLLAAWAVLGTGHRGFQAHAAGHVALGMAAPLLVTLAAPVTLLLRSVPVWWGRRVSRVLRSVPLRALTHPVTALVLDAGGLWLLYATPLHDRLADHPLTHVHVFAAGCLLAASLVGPDPAPHRATWGLRAAVLVTYIAAHGTLAKFLSGHPPAGVTAGEALAGAKIMYYAGDAVHVVLLVLLFLPLYRRNRLFSTVPARVAAAYEHRHEL